MVIVLINILKVQICCEYYVKLNTHMEVRIVKQNFRDTRNKYFCMIWWTYKTCYVIVCFSWNILCEEQVPQLVFYITRRPTSISAIVPKTYAAATGEKQDWKCNTSFLCRWGGSLKKQNAELQSFFKEKPAIILQNIALFTLFRQWWPHMFQTRKWRNKVK